MNHDTSTKSRQYFKTCTLSFLTLYAKVTFEANSLLDKWRIFDTHLTSFLLLRVYSTLRSASEYLQAEGLDYLSAWNMVEKAKEVLKNLDFKNIMKTKQKFHSKCSMLMSAYPNNGFLQSSANVSVLLIQPSSLKQLLSRCSFSYMILKRMLLLTVVVQSSF
jgi:hypothetical protein